MLDIFSVVKTVAIGQFLLVILLLLFAFGIKMFTYYRAAYLNALKQSIRRLMKHGIEQPADFDLKSIMRYKKHTDILIQMIHQFDVAPVGENWMHLRVTLMDLILIPTARVMAQSRQWYKRYLACLAFQLSSHKIDTNLIVRLINDPVPLVAMNAAIFAVNAYSQEMIDALIDTFSQGRRVQQSLYAQIISSAHSTIIPLVKNRLSREQDPFIKAFCYRTLTYLPSDFDVVTTVDAEIDFNLVTTVYADLNAENVDLKVAVLYYLYHFDPRASGKVLVSHLNDAHWEVRAKSAKLLGELGDALYAFELDKCLKDPEWWVRMNAAEALGALGEEGMLILKNQTPDGDQYAYDAAMRVLLTKN
ncbi:MAG TPA: hypothetical protein DDY37_08080 [Legionella sp.]|nr:hypothetical protein [Legionella sp.]